LSDRPAAPDESDAPDASDASGARCGDEIVAGQARWQFGGTVPDRFETHIERSVPGYRDSHALIASLSDFFLHDGSLTYELGCATGAVSRAVAERHHGRKVRIVGIEREATMAERARTLCRDLPSIEIVEADLLELQFEPCDLIVAHYTLQFVRPAVRQQLFDRIHAALNWGGALVLFEKVRAPDARFQDLVSALYTDHKLAQGFSEAEIVNKARSLKGVLEPFSSQGNLDLMARAGFVDVMSVWKHLCFEGFLAIK